jgi:hypothetical protein
MHSEFHGYTIQAFCHPGKHQPHGLSIALTDRSSYKIGIGSHSGSSIEFGLAMRHRSSRREEAQTFRQYRQN